VTQEEPGWGDEESMIALFLLTPQRRCAQFVWLLRTPCQGLHDANEELEGETALPLRKARQSAPPLQPKDTNGTSSTAQTGQAQRSRSQASRCTAAVDGYFKGQKIRLSVLCPRRRRARNHT